MRRSSNRKENLGSFVFGLEQAQINGIINEFLWHKKRSQEEKKTSNKFLSNVNKGYNLHTRIFQ